MILKNQKQLNKVRHDYLRYANCWEDADVLLEGLNPSEGGRFLSIGSAGDNSFSLLTTNPEIVIAVDINPIQLKLIELKKAAIKHFSRTEFLEFTGFEESKNRIILFNKIKNTLKSETASFWKSKKELIENGLVYGGKFEKYFKLFSNKILPIIHNKKRISELFREKPDIEQKLLYSKQWNSLRWNLFFKLFFSKFVMGRFGRSKEFMNEVEIPIGEFIFGKAEKHLGNTNCQKNYFLQFILNGNFSEYLPHYVRKENYYTIQQNIEKLDFIEGLAESTFKRYSNFNYFNLSDIFEYMNPELFKTVAGNFIENSEKNARFAYWNLMVPRFLSEINPDKFEYQKSLSEELSEIDKGFFYGKFIIDKRI